MKIVIIILIMIIIITIIIIIITIIITKIIRRILRIIRRPYRSACENNTNLVNTKSNRSLPITKMTKLKASKV